VAREARRSRNPLYTTHRNILAEIETSKQLPGTTADLGARIEQLEHANAQLRRELRKLRLEQQALATENLSLFQRAQVAEARLAMHRAK
jgi:hypothetical protein